MHGIQQLQDQSLSLSVFHTVVVRTQGQWRMMISALYKRGAAGALNAGLCGAHSTDFPGVAVESSGLIQSYTRFTGSPFPFAKRSYTLVLSSQRDAQVARREPQKAFGHQPSTQAAQVPGGGRGHQGGPQVLPLSRGHQQRVHRGADIAHHRLLWIPALECKLQ